MYIDTLSIGQNDIQLEANKGATNLIIENALYMLYLGKNPLMIINKKIYLK